MTVMQGSFSSSLSLCMDVWPGAIQGNPAQQRMGMGQGGLSG